MNTLEAIMNRKSIRTYADRVYFEKCKASAGDGIKGMV